MSPKLIRNVLLLSPYPGSLINSIEKYADVVTVFNGKINQHFLKINSFDFIITYGYKFLLNKETLKSIKGAAINLHISYLPFNRGSHPNVWSHLEGTTSGVTIHLIDETLDTGNILFQMEVPINQYEHTFSSSYTLLRSKIEYLFQVNWHSLRKDELIGVKQKEGGTYHRNADLEALKPYLTTGWDTNIAEAKANFLNGLTK